MSKKIRFPLEMENGVKVRSVDELKENFSLAQVLMYISNGRMVTWLRDRYADDIADAIEQLDKSDEKFLQKVSELFDVPYDKLTVESMEKAKERSRRLELLKNYTLDKQYLKVVDRIAFDQDELYDLLDENENEIYLCGDKFSIPLAKKGIHYIGINTPIVTIGSKTEVDWDEKGIYLSQVKFDEKYQAVLDSVAETKKKLYQQFGDSLRTMLGGHSTAHVFGAYSKKSYLNFMLTPDEKKASQKSYNMVCKDIQNIDYDINRDIENAKSMILTAGIVGLADRYIENL